MIATLNQIDLNAAIRLAAASEFDRDRVLHHDLFDMIAIGEENAQDDLGREFDGVVVEHGNEAYYALAHATIGGFIADRYFDPRHGSTPARVRDWFAQFISF